MVIQAWLPTKLDKKASVLSNIKKIYCYPLFKSKNLHLVNAAKEFTEKSLKIKNCPTETKFFINKVEIDNINKKFGTNKFKISTFLNLYFTYFLSKNIKNSWKMNLLLLDFTKEKEMKRA